MRQLLIVLIEVGLIIGLWAGIYFPYLYKETVRSFPDKPLMSRQLHLLNFELEEELIYFLARQLGIYEGEFEIVDVVNLDTDQVAGTDYILITLKAPDGKLCQITVSRKSSPWAQWELNPENFNVVDFSMPGPVLGVEIPQWMKDLKITPEQVRAYFATHPQMAEKGEGAFIDEKTKKYKLPSDWYQTVKLETVFKLEISKNKPIRFVSSMGESAKINALNSFWKADYPIEYSGPGYRAYLYGKVKGTE